MGKLIVEQVVTVDGFAASPDGGIAFFDEGKVLSEMEPAVLAMLAKTDAIILGANTYKMFVEYWPSADPEQERVATPINTLPKHVFSSKLTEAPWGSFAPAILEREDAASRVEALKGAYAGDLVVWGSLTLTEALFRLGLVDVVRTRTVPVLIGAGRSIAPKDLGSVGLELVRSKQFPRGGVLNEYAVQR